MRQRRTAYSHGAGHGGFRTEGKGCRGHRSPTVFLTLLSTRTQQPAWKCSQNLTFTLGRITLFQTSEMAPKRKQTTKSSSTVTSTISTKPADKEEQAKARALKRAERVEARRAEAEKRKEAVRPLLCHLCHHWQHQLQSGGYRRATRRQRRLTVTFSGKRSLPRGRIPRGHQGVRICYRNSGSQCSVFVELGRSVA